MVQYRRWWHRRQTKHTSIIVALCGCQELYPFGVGIWSLRRSSLRFKNGPKWRYPISKSREVGDEASPVASILNFPIVNGFNAGATLGNIPFWFKLLAIHTLFNHEMKKSPILRFTHTGIEMKRLQHNVHLVSKQRNKRNLEYPNLKMSRFNLFFRTSYLPIPSRPSAPKPKGMKLGGTIKSYHHAANGDYTLLPDGRYINKSCNLLHLIFRLGCFP